MRITVGHVLIGGMLGFFSFQLIKPGNSIPNKDLGFGLWAEAQSWFNFFKTGETLAQKKDDKSSSDESSSSAQNKTEGSVPTNSVAVSAPIEVKPSAPVVPVSPVPTVVPTSAPVANKKVVYRKRGMIRRQRVAVKPAAVAAIEVKPKVKDTVLPVAANDPLVGNYVRVELISGKKIQGILQERNAKEIKLELPGMGPIPYSVNTIKSIQAME